MDFIRDDICFDEKEKKQQRFGGSELWSQPNSLQINKATIQNFELFSKREFDIIELVSISWKTKKKYE